MIVLPTTITSPRAKRPAPRYVTHTELTRLLPDAAEAMAWGANRIVYSTCERTSTEYRVERVVVSGRYSYSIQPALD